MKLAGIAAAALVPMLMFAANASAAAPQTITYKLRASAAGQSSDFTLDQGVDASAPATVAPNGTVAVTVDPAPNKIPTEAGGRQVREIKGLALRLPVPANSKFQSASLSGGSGLGGTPTVALSGNDVVLTVPGPIKGGADFELPTVTINLQAGGTGTITTKLGGTSYDAPGLTFTAVVVVIGFPINAAAKGYPDPNPVLTTTTIG
ncbi:cyclase [Lentzea sp. BCCO 10_0061]|uniref:Cyclase n=1 Tax=Lentzea sokolovensis TaxID=3095429 RepID=A0ABU4V441_9PSEU|nr:cyclase [Lentzea sp. BCCO 10_0061]MDX8146575.1 cyclase [Lentzea sp. BCCO 10_0061]